MGINQKDLAGKLKESVEKDHEDKEDKSGDKEEKKETNAEDQSSNELIFVFMLKLRLNCDKTVSIKFMKSSFD